MLAKRIIACMDIHGGRVVKGRRFENLVDAGDPVEMARRYSEEGVDELAILDISASREEREPFYDMVQRIARCVSIPLTVGGGIRTVPEVVELLRCGADKIVLNSALVKDPFLLAHAAERVGSQALVAAIDAVRDEYGWKVRVKSGTQETGRDVPGWAQECVKHGAGELLVTSIDSDGMKSGYDCRLLAALRPLVSVPIVASGGAGSMQHVLDALNIGGADAALVAGLFHFREMTIADLKRFLQSKGIAVRL